MKRNRGPRAPVFVLQTEYESDRALPLAALSPDALACRSMPSFFSTWVPATCDFGLVKADAVEAASAYRRMFEADGWRFEEQILAGPLETLLDLLPPLTMGMRKALFIPGPAGWTGFFREGLKGSDPFMPMWHLARRNEMLAMRVCCHTSKPYPGTIWEVYAPPSLGGDKSSRRRSIAASNDGGRWVFEESGERYPFEDADRYAGKIKRTRFTGEMLEQYLAQFGTAPLEPRSFTATAQSPAVLLRDVSRVNPLPEWSVEDVRAGVPWKRPVESKTPP